eukprot:m.90170 g.90170  ORF g.90170 m.90170 type:complete len:475 (+) comp26371_c0_seq2:150-1574(+)
MAHPYRMPQCINQCMRRLHQQRAIMVVQRRNLVTSKFLRTSSENPAKDNKLHVFGLSPSQLFANVPTLNLAVSFGIFSACSKQWLIGPSIKILRSTSSGPGRFVTQTLMTFSRKLVFPHFCAGEKLEDCVRVAEEFEKMGNVGVMIDHSIEEGETPDDWAINLKNKSELLRKCKTVLGESLHFVPLKITALVSPKLLEEMNAILTRHPNHLHTTIDPRANMSVEMMSQLNTAITNLSNLCDIAQSVDLPLLLDAEQSNRQHALDFISSILMEKYNKHVDRPIVYNTYQMYMRGADERVTRDMEHGVAKGYTFAAKIVRGAYLIGEAEMASKLGVSNPLHAHKHDTDSAYDRAIEKVLIQINEKPLSAAVVIATHNYESIEHAINTMHRLGLAPNHHHIHFGQIMGMADHITIALGLMGYNSLKLVLFGKFDDVFPWLIRRLDENRDMLGASQRGLPLLQHELNSRWRVLNNKFD